MTSAYLGYQLVKVASSNGFVQPVTPYKAKGGWNFQKLMEKRKGKQDLDPNAPQPIVPGSLIIRPRDPDSEEMGDDPMLAMEEQLNQAMGDSTTLQKELETSRMEIDKYRAIAEKTKAETDKIKQEASYAVERASQQAELAQARADITMQEAKSKMEILAEREANRMPGSVSHLLSSQANRLSKRVETTHRKFNKLARTLDAMYKSSGEMPANVVELRKKEDGRSDELKALHTLWGEKTDVETSLPQTLHRHNIPALKNEDIMPSFVRSDGTTNYATTAPLAMQRAAYNRYAKEHPIITGTIAPFLLNALGVKGDPSRFATGVGPSNVPAMLQGDAANMVQQTLLRGSI